MESVKRAGRNDTELIVVDDGSTDERTQHEMKYLEREGVRTIRQKNSGLAAARNIGIQAAQGRYILPLDADNRIRSNYLTSGISLLDRNPTLGIVYGDAEYFGVRTGRWRVGEFDRVRLLRWNYIDACAVFRKLVWEQNGGYDGTMPVQGLEDWDFWLGATERGWGFSYVPEILFDYRVARESMITRAASRISEVESFIASKHARLYRDAYLELTKDCLSVRGTMRNLMNLIGSRFRTESTLKELRERLPGKQL